MPPLDSIVRERKEKDPFKYGFKLIARQTQK